MRPFDFPKAWGKLGNWPGYTNVNAAQTILQKTSELKPDAGIAVLGFDGGRTLIVAGWGARQFSLKVNLIMPRAEDPDSELWYYRATRLFDLEKIVTRTEDDTPRPYDMLVSAFANEWTAAWIEQLKPNGSLCLVGPAANYKCELTSIVSLPNQIAIWEKPEATSNIIELPDMQIQVNNVVSLNGENGNGKAPIPMYPRKKKDRQPEAAKSIAHDG